jgi:Cys-rich four helix bundle protein (predicted Tat secretion target)
MDRREFMLAGASVIAATAATPAFAQAHDQGQGAAGGGKKTAQSTAKNRALVDAAADCAKAGDVCLEHCFTLLRNGDKSIAKCSATVAQMIPMCRALEALAIQDATELKAHAATCAKVCRECEAACKVHASHHAQCKRCMETCQHCAAACDKVAA